VIGKLYWQANFGISLVSLSACTCMYCIYRPSDRVQEKKRKLCGFWEANCAVKSGNYAGIERDCAIV